MARKKKKKKRRKTVTPPGPPPAEIPISELIKSVLAKGIPVEEQQWEQPVPEVMSPTGIDEELRELLD